MSMHYTLADLFTHIRNGHAAKKQMVRLPSSSLKEAVLSVLEKQGYINGFKIDPITPAKNQVEVYLKYYDGKPVIRRIDCESRPGLRIYKSAKELPRVLGGLGIAIVSTSHGVMSDKEARTLGHGGEVLCTVE